MPLAQEASSWALTAKSSKEAQEEESMQQRYGRALEAISLLLDSFASPQSQSLDLSEQDCRQKCRAALLSFGCSQDLPRLDHPLFHQLFVMLKAAKEKR